MSLTEEQKKAYREELGKMEAQTIRDSRKRLSTDDFDSLAIIGRGAFGEVRMPTAQWVWHRNPFILLFLSLCQE